MFQRDDVTQEFLIESLENLDRIDRELIVLEQSPEDRQTLASIFRSIHSIKGASGFLGHTRLESVSHAGENLLSKLRDGELTLDRQLTSALLSLVDAIRDMLGHIATSGKDGDHDFTELVDILTNLANGRPSPNVGAKPSGSQSAPLPGNRASESASSIGQQPNDAEHVSAASHDANQNTGPKAEASATSAPQPAENKPIADNNVRVDVGLLDNLMNLVGELVLTRNQILQFTDAATDTAFLGATARLNLITSELQESVMKTRMQPIGNVWGKLPRIVRDLSLMCGKQVRVEMEGKETELDKTIIEAIRDPLTHIVRNSVDHGIERPDTRIARGKSAEGCLTLRAYHEGGQVNIEISDDGGGIPPDKVKAKAVQKRLITAEQAARMSDREAVELIFLPGFSTAEQVTNVSGRGVGMDVVKTNIEKIGGAAEISSRPGHGTMLKIRIPLTLAIIPALMVKCGSDRYAIPQLNLVELIRLEGDEKRKVEQVHDAPVLRVRGSLLPLVWLRRELQLPPLESSANTSNVEHDLNIVILQADGRQFGLVVDTIHDTGEIVVKPLGQQLKNLKVFAGATILGDGQVALILDVLGLAQRSRVITGPRERTESANKTATVEQVERQSLLLFQLDKQTRAALPLSSVARLEKFSAGDVEQSGNQRVIQYRNTILPLKFAAEIWGDSSLSEFNQPLPDPFKVVVYSDNGRQIGVIVENIHDIVEQELRVCGEPNRVGASCSAVIQGKVAELLDVGRLARVVPGSEPNTQLAQ